MKNILSPREMLKKEHLLGEIPSAKEAYGTVLRIALPSVIEMVLMSLIGSMDTIMVGQLGAPAIAAVGLTGQPRMLLLSVFFALNIGVTAVVARRKGEERQDIANLTLRNALVVIALLSVVITIFSAFFSKGLVNLAGAKADTIADANLYFRIMAFATPIQALTMAITASQRGIGNTKVTLYVNGASNIVNVIFNYLLIGGKFGFPKLGVAGAAIASVIGLCVGFVLSIFSITRKKSYIRLHFKESWRLNPPIIRALFQVGGNAVLEQIALRIGFFVFARMVADLGTDAFATHQICMQFLNITFTFGDGIGVAGTSLVGQNLGRKRPDLSMIYGKVSQRIALIVSFLLVGILIVFRTPLVMLFNTEPHIVSMGANLMLIVAIFQPFQTSSVVISGCLRGAGDTRFVALIMMICITFIRPIACALAIYVFDLGLMGAWYASLLDMCIRLICVYLRFHSFRWAKIQV